MDAPLTTCPAHNGTAARFTSCERRPRPRPRGRGRPSWTAASPSARQRRPHRSPRGSSRRRSASCSPNTFAMPHATAGITRQLSTTMSTTSTQRLSGARTCSTVKDMPSESTVATIDTATPALKSSVNRCSADIASPPRRCAVASLPLVPAAAGQGSFRPRRASSAAYRAISSDGARPTRRSSVIAPSDAARGGRTSCSSGTGSADLPRRTARWRTDPSDTRRCRRTGRRSPGRTSAACRTSPARTSAARARRSARACARPMLPSR